MNIKLDGSFINEKTMVEKYRGYSSKALDYLWTTHWVKEGIMPNFENGAEELRKAADTLRFACEKIFVVAGGCILASVKAVLGSCENDGRIIFLGDSISPAEYGEIIKTVKGFSLGMIAISCKEEPVEQIAAFSIARDIIKNLYGMQEFEKRIVIITGKNGVFLPQIASEGTSKLRLLSEDAEEDTAISTEALIFPIAAAGINPTVFLRNFKEILTSTMWDLDGDRYSLFLTEAAKKHGRCEDIIFWQREFSGIANWICALHRKLGIDSKAVYAPGELTATRKGASQTHLFCEEENLDVITPIFPGASMEGTLSHLVKERQELLYRENKNARFKITIERFDVEAIAQLMTFLQISNEISRYILKKS